MTLWTIPRVISIFVYLLSRMSSIFSPTGRHNNLAAVHSFSTKPELKLRHTLWRHGFRYLVNVKRLPGKPDIVLPKYRTVIFVHGCFWHGHNNCKNYTIPKTNTDFWVAKVSRNQERDQKVWRQLEALGWSVIIVWECQLRRAALDETVSKVESDIKKNGDRYAEARIERKRLKDDYRHNLNQRKEAETKVRQAFRKNKTNSQPAE